MFAYIPASFRSFGDINSVFGNKILIVPRNTGFYELLFNRKVHSSQIRSENLLA
jgi:hypothetical protein